MPLALLVIKVCDVVGRRDPHIEWRRVAHLDLQVGNVGLSIFVCINDPAEAIRQELRNRGSKEMLAPRSRTGIAGSTVV